MKKTLTLPLVLSSMLLGAGYQIPNNSVNSVALSTANIAHASGADTAYYNPAKMSHNEDKHMIEGSLTYVNLTPINYKSSDDTYDINSKRHTAWIPSLHYVSKKLNDNGVRIGFSIVAPAGLTREWKDMPASATAKKFALEVMEFNPSVSIPLNKKLALGFGFRYVRAKGEVKTDAGGAVALNMKGTDTASFGYNLALSYQASEALNISATYRSKISLDIEGDADAYIAALGANANQSSDVSMEVPVPANLILAAAYTFDTGTTLEITYDRTMWSAIKEQNFEFSNATVEAILGNSSDKKWHDSEAYRMGITQELDKLTLMAGIAYSTNPADEEYVSFSSPESDSMTYSIGGRYSINESLEVGLAALYSENKTRKVSQASALGVNGTLSNKSVYTLTAGLAYKF